MLNLLKSAQHRLPCEVVKLLAAQVIVASLHAADAELAITVGKEGLLEKWNVFLEKLLLQVLGPCRNDHVLARADHRHEVSDCLSCSGSSFDDEMAALFDGFFYCLRHLQLTPAVFIRRMRAGKQSAGSKKLVQRGSGGSCGLRTGRHRVSIIAVEAGLGTGHMAETMWGRAPRPSGRAALDNLVD